MFTNHELIVLAVTVAGLTFPFLFFAWLDFTSDGGKDRGEDEA